MFDYRFQCETTLLQSTLYWLLKWEGRGGEARGGEEPHVILIISLEMSPERETNLRSIKQHCSLIQIKMLLPSNNELVQSYCSLMLWYLNTRASLVLAISREELDH